MKARIVAPGPAPCRSSGQVPGSGISPRDGRQCRGFDDMFVPRSTVEVQVVIAVLSREELFKSPDRFAIFTMRTLASRTPITPFSLHFQPRYAP